MDNTSNPRLANIHPVGRKKFWVLDENAKFWKVFPNRLQGLQTMKFDQTEQGNMGFD
jgi:hypothetical protein